MKTAKQMFGGIARDMAATARYAAMDQADRERRAQEAEARWQEPLTRREVVDAIEAVAGEYNGQHGDATRGMLRRLAEALS